MKGFFIRFWTSVVSLAGVVGLYLAADAAKLLIAFWIVVFGGIVAAGARPAWRFIGDFSTRQRNYPRLIERVATLEMANKQLTQAETEARAATEQLAMAMLHEGRMQVFAWLRGKSIAPIPVISSVKIDDGELVLVAQYAGKMALTPRERFTVAQKDTGEVKGAVMCSRTDQGRNLVYLQLVENAAPAFWDAVRDRAFSEPAPPDMIELVSYRLGVSIPTAGLTLPPLNLKWSTHG